jgi:hypothetical protein
MEQGKIVFEGTLVEMPPDAPRCGDTKVAVAHRFRVERVVAGKLKEKNVVVLIACPDLKGDGFFEVESRYHIEATSDLKEAGSHTTYNDYVDGPVLWAVNITRLKEKRK